mgnify:CR=1 FL=1
MPPCAQPCPRVFFRPSPAVGQAGFTLLELAVVLAVLGVLLTGLLGPLQQLRTHQRQQDARAALAAIRQTLLGFAMSHGRLPCPANPALAASDAQAGLAQPDTGAPCARQVGVLPWKTLGLVSMDPWGRRYTYAVAGRYSQTITQLAYPQASSASELAEAAWYVHLSPTPTPPAVAQQWRVAALVLSHGANGHGGWSDQGVQLPPAAGSAGEQLNAVGNTRTLGSNAAPNPFYGPASPGADSDDVLDSLPAPLVLHALVSAGRLP